MNVGVGHAPERDERRRQERARPLDELLVGEAAATALLRRALLAGRDRRIEHRRESLDGILVLACVKAVLPELELLGLVGSGSRRDHKQSKAEHGGSAKPANEAAEKNYSVVDLWVAAGDDEGRSGLDFGFMLSSVSQLCELGLQSKHKSITALSAVGYLKARVERELQRPGLADAQKKVLERSKKHLSMVMSKYGTVELIESEYRRLLKAQVLQAFSPCPNEMNQRPGCSLARFCALPHHVSSGVTVARTSGRPSAKSIGASVASLASVAMRYSGIVCSSSIVRRA